MIIKLNTVDKCYLFSLCIVALYHSTSMACLRNDSTYIESLAKQTPMLKELAGNYLLKTKRIPSQASIPVDLLEYLKKLSTNQALLPRLLCSKKD